MCYQTSFTKPKLEGEKMIAEQLKVKQGTIICQVCEDVIDTVDSPEGVKTWYGVCKGCSNKKIKPVSIKPKLGGEKKMAEQLKVKQGTIICQVCEDVIDTVDSPEGVKTWYGVCKGCSNKKIKPVFIQQKLGGEKKMVEQLKVKQGTIICQVCEDVIDTVDSPEGVKTWYGVCKGCSKKKIKQVVIQQKLEGEKMMVKELKVKQGTIICQVCEGVIDVVDSLEGVKTWYGVCKGCCKEKKEN